MNEVDNNSGFSLKALKEHREFETEIIKTYESLPQLWNTKHPDYNNKYIRREAHMNLLRVIKKVHPEATTYHVRNKINCLRSNYRKELKRHLSSKRIGPDGEECYTYVPANWKFYMLRFLGGDESLEDEAKSKRSQMESTSTVDNDNNDDPFRDVDVNNCQIQEPVDSESSDAEFYGDDIYLASSSVMKPCKRIKLETDMKDNISTDIYDTELRAIASNVVCKLKRMDAEQRGHAELLINKVLLSGLRNCLSFNTDLAEVDIIHKDN